MCDILAFIYNRPLVPHNVIKKILAFQHFLQSKKLNFESKKEASTKAFGCKLKKNAHEVMMAKLNYE